MVNYADFCVLNFFRLQNRTYKPLGANYALDYKSQYLVLSNLQCSFVSSGEKIQEG